jgi:hypothetical protein
MFEVAQSVVAALRRQNGDSPWKSHRDLRSDSPHFAGEVKCEAVNLFLADGELAGQEVPHVHLHVMPRLRGDGFSLKLPPGYGRHPERSELDRIATAIKAGLTNPPG